MAKLGTSIGDAWSVRKSSDVSSITWLDLDGVISAVANARGGLGVSIAYYLVLVGLDELLGEATEVIAAEEGRRRRIKEDHCWTCGKALLQLVGAKAGHSCSRECFMPLLEFEEILMLRFILINARRAGDKGFRIG